MFVLKLVLVCVVLIQCDAAFVDSLPKCSIIDDDCIGGVFENSLRKIGSVGIPEINMPPIDPLKVTNVTMKVLDMVNIILTDGVVRGISKCKSKKFHIELEKRTGVLELICDIVIKGSIIIQGTSPALQGIFGTPTVDGAGKGKVKLEKLFLHFDFPLMPFKKDDGKVYFKVLHKNMKYKHDVEKVTFAAEKLMVGSEDISKVVIPYLNDNYKMVLEIFGGPLFDKTTEITTDFLKIFYENTPADLYIVENLNSYLIN
ncbi:uncharacterized protein LOC112057160 [Bicyclus anynana]|uniref:Uncharacterized protein LOC112057160 n=1 Tax=Bicyclus anynana TaxID=110368 RepID=A0ABM3LPP1_BICAN|nr:uncharacterized protein LOC112057160 [Bicyclus anynana]